VATWVGHAVLLVLVESICDPGPFPWYVVVVPVVTVSVQGLFVTFPEGRVLARSPSNR
jgi:hypothetical protein